MTRWFLALSFCVCVFAGGCTSTGTAFIANGDNATQNAIMTGETQPCKTAKSELTNTGSNTSQTLKNSTTTTEKTQ